MNYLDKGILVLATMEMAKRKKEMSFCPTEVVKWIYPSNWESFMDDENRAVAWLHEKGLITLENEGITPHLGNTDGVIKIKLGKIS
ncbi:DUF3253 domain-containing protein [Cyclobacterium amurskyense]|uniref:DUF3253 domain-containing protein n=1 Tax=Cyclobacterium amurskyense TaxID=320787 RepID=UPI0030DD352B|tara:strand:- start:1941 stop:2198 length:258 start_codon:yes stop_codon:yes gene_type:complete